MTQAKAGRKKIVVDPEAAKMLAAGGLSNRAIAAALRISEDTLSRRVAESADLAEAIKEGRGVAEKEISDLLMGMARTGNVAAAIWLEKTRFGRSDRVAVESDSQVQITVTYEQDPPFDSSPTAPGATEDPT